MMLHIMENASIATSHFTTPAASVLSTAYMEQWICWIGVNVSTIIMWVLTLRQEPGSSFALIYVVKYSFYLLNSLNGLRIWLKLSRSETP